MARRTADLTSVPDDAYLAAVKMLARRELSERQVRQRLVRKQFDSAGIDDAITRLKGERAIDDARVAGAIARLETNGRRRGLARVRQKLMAAGIASPVADAAVEDIAAQVDLDALLAQALERRLRGRTTIEDEREMARLFRQLVTQGFESDRVMRLLRSRRR
jgi:regulatory protein